MDELASRMLSFIAFSSRYIIFHAPELRVTRWLAI